MPKDRARFFWSVLGHTLYAPTRRALVYHTVLFLTSKLYNYVWKKEKDIL